MDEHTTERGAKPMVDGAVYAFSFIDDDATRTSERRAALFGSMDITLRELQRRNPAAKWRDVPRIERNDDKVTIRARLVS